MGCAGTEGDTLMVAHPGSGFGSSTRHAAGNLGLPADSMNSNIHEI
jgi:hypothetical protein